MGHHNQSIGYIKQTSKQAASKQAAKHETILEGFKLANEIPHSLVAHRGPADQKYTTNIQKNIQDLQTYIKIYKMPSGGGAARPGLEAPVPGRPMAPGPGCRTALLRALKFDAARREPWVIILWP